MVGIWSLELGISVRRELLEVFDVHRASVRIAPFDQAVVDEPGQAFLERERARLAA